MNVVVDSNMLIYYLNAALPPNTRVAVEGTIQTGEHISVITRIEILGWPGQTQSSYGRAQGLLGLLTEHPLTNEIADLCIALRQKRRIKTPNAIIAATALHLGMPLLTRNEDDFKGMAGLRLLNPFEPSPSSS